MNDIVFANSQTKCDNSNCKFVKGHSSVCSNMLGKEVAKCSNHPCCRSNGHCGDCLFYKQDESIMSQQSVAPQPQYNAFNMQYQSLVNDNTKYSNFNNNNDQRKFVINYVTVNNYYGNTQPSSIIPKMEDIMENSQFNSPSSHLINYRR